MNEIAEVPSPRVVRKVKNYIRLLGIEERIQNVTGLPNDSPGVRTTALDKLRSERRSEEKDRRRRIDKKYEIFNGNAFEEDLGILLRNTLDSEHKFSPDHPDLSHIHLVSIDMRMLNYFNSLPSEFDAGDAYKKFVADTLSGKIEGTKKWKTAENFSYTSYLTGGDEFKILITADKEKVKEFIQTLSDSVAQYRHPEDDIWASGVDIGVESLDHVVGDIHRDDGGAWIRDLPTDQKRTLVGKLFNAHSERRVTLQKFLSRIEYLHSIYETNPGTFDHVYAFATKGGIQITKDELLALFNAGNREEAVRVYVRDVFAKKDELGLLRNQGDPFQGYKFQSLKRLSAQLLSGLHPAGGA